MTALPPNEPTPNNPQAQPTPVPPTAPLGYSSPTSGLPYTGPEPTKDDKTMGMLAHLLGILGFLGPLIIWLIKKDTSPFVNDQGKEALNFHLTLLIGLIIGLATSCLGIGLVIITAVWILGVIFSIMGAMQANAGVAYRYPFAIRFIK
jgi:hypothetical protein